MPRGRKKSPDTIRRKIQDMEEDFLLKAYIHEIDRISQLTKEEEQELAKRMAGNGPDAKEARRKLVQSNLKFVISVAKQYMNKGVSFLDLISEGNVGLLMAANRYDYRKGYKFISYAVWWIKQYIAKAFLEQSKLIRLPFNRKLQFYKIKNLQKERSSKEGELSHREIARILSMKERDVGNIIEATKEHISIFGTMPNGKREVALSEILVDAKYSDPETNTLYKSLRETISELLEELTERERLIITYRFGLETQSSLSLSKIAEKLNVTKERIRQIEKRAITKLKALSIDKDLQVYLNS